MRPERPGPASHVGISKPYPCGFPPLPEQKRIAEILDRAESLRAKRRAALAQFETLTQSVFVEMFGDPRQNPKGFEIVPLGRYVTVAGGFMFKSEEFADHGEPVIRISNLTGDGVDLEGVARIPRDKLGRGENFRINPGDILIAMSGATTGKLGVVPADFAGSIYQNQRVGNFRIGHSDTVERRFLEAYLRSDFYQQFLKNLAAGAAQPNVSSGQLESAPLALPPFPLQQEFARRAAAVENLKAKHRQSLAELDALFASLQHRAFAGEL